MLYTEKDVYETCCGYYLINMPSGGPPILKKDYIIKILEQYKIGFIFSSYEYNDIYKAATEVASVLNNTENVYQKLKTEKGNEVFQNVDITPKTQDELVRVRFTEYFQQRNWILDNKTMILGKGV